MPWVTHIPRPNGFDYWSIWLLIVPVDATRSWRLEISTRFEFGIWRLLFHFSTVGTGWAGRFIAYERQYAEGFPRWEDSILVPFRNHNAWIWGTPPTQLLRPVIYSRLPPNFCIP